MILDYKKCNELLCSDNIFFNDILQYSSDYYTNYKAFLQKIEPFEHLLLIINAGDTQYKNRVSPAYNYITAFILLVMEQPDSGKCHHHIILVTALNDKIVTYGTAGLCNVFYATLICSLNVI